MNVRRKQRMLQQPQCSGIRIKVQGQPGLYSKTLSQSKQQKKESDSQHYQMKIEKQTPCLAKKEKKRSH
jgi:hypothetical protein